MFDDIDVTNKEPSPATLDSAPREMGAGEATAKTSTVLKSELTSFDDQKPEANTENMS